MRANVKPRFSRPTRQLRSIVVSLPFNAPSGDYLHWRKGRFERWLEKTCNGEKLRRFGDKVREKFSLPKPRLWCVGLSRRYQLHLWVYEGAGTPAERRLFKRVQAYVEKHAPIGARQV